MVTFFIALTTAPLACGDDPPRDPATLYAEIRAELEAQRVALGVPALSIAVVIDGQLAFADGLGVCSQSDPTPATARTLFRTTSTLTKPLVAATALDLQEDGLLDLDAPIVDYLDYLELPATHLDVTIADGLTHRSGLEIAHYRQGCEGDSATFEAYFDHPLEALSPRGAVFNYSANGFAMAAAAIEAVTGERFTEVMAERLLTPMGMTSATFDVALAAATEHAEGHVLDGGTRSELKLIDVPWNGCPEWEASAGLMASAEDHGHFMAAMMSDDGPLSPATLANMRANHTNPHWGPFSGYGLGLMTMDYKGVQVVGHGGSVAGFLGVVQMVPSRRFGVAILANDMSDDTYLYLDRKVYDVITRFLELKGPEPVATTAPETYEKYLGTYVDPSLPVAPITVSREGDGALHLSIPALQLETRLDQGSAGAFTGGDTFSYRRDELWVDVSFQPDGDGEDYDWVVVPLPLHTFIARRVE